MISLPQFADRRKDDPAAARGRIVHRRAVWRASQPHADTNAVFTAAFEANQQLVCRLDLKTLKGIARKARAVLAIAHFRDPVLYFHAQERVAEAQAALLTLHWPGAFARNCRLAMTSILSKMYLTGKTELALSVRSLADAIGVTRKSTGLYLSALTGKHRRTTVPVLLTCRSLRSTQPTASNVYQLRPQRAWRLPAGGLLLCGVRNAENMGEKSAENARKITTRDRVLGAIAHRSLASAQELASATGLSGKTTKLTLTWLRKNEIVKKTEGVYQLAISHWRQDTVPVAHDAFRARGLGKGCAFALAAIEQEPIASARELAAATACTLDAAERALTQLRQAGVVEKVSGVYQRTGTALNTVAVRLGTADVGVRQERQHRHERSEFALQLKSGELQPGYGKRGLHLVSIPQPPEILWRDSEVRRR